MRIALLSDIHGNLVALKAVLADMRAASPDMIVCLGDVGADGPDPRGVLAELQAFQASFIMGNADEQLLDPHIALFVAPNEDTPKFQAVWEWGAAQLNADERAFVQSFQPTISIPLSDDLGVLCYHGSPRSNVEAIHATTPDETLDSYFEGQSARIMIGGHTHQAFLRRHRHHWVINPGSIGLPFEWNPQRNQMINPARAEYALLTWQAGQWSVDLRAIPFDLEAYITSVHQSGMPYADWLLSDWQTA
jgi:putative phosphoesterase